MAGWGTVPNPRKVALVGTGGAGHRAVEKSLFSGVRQVRYAVLENAGGCRQDSAIAHRVLVEHAGEGPRPRFTRRLQRSLAGTFGDCDVAVVVGGCGTAFDAELLVRAARAAGVSGRVTLVLLLMSRRPDGRAAWRLVAATLKFLRSIPCIVVPTITPGSDDGDCFPLLELVLDEALRPRDASLLRGLNGDGAVGRVGALATFPVDASGRDSAEFDLAAREWASPLFAELPNWELAIGGAAGVSLAEADRAARRIRDALGSAAANPDLVMSPREDGRGGLVLLANGDPPRRLLRVLGGLYRNAASADVKDGPPPPRLEGDVLELGPELMVPASGGRVTRAGAAAHGRPYPALSGWTYDLLEPSAAVTVRLAAGSTAPLPGPAFGSAALEPGSLAARLDSLAQHCDAVAATILRWLPGAIQSVRAGGGATVLAQIRRSVGNAAARVRARGGGARLTAGAVMVVILVTPSLLARVAVSALAAVAHSQRLGGSPGEELVLRFEQVDRARVLAAAHEAKLTRTPFGELGLASAARPAMAAHLDLLAVDRAFFGLQKLGSGPPPFRWINQHDPRVRGRLRLLVSALGENSDSRALALSALGFSMRAPDLASLSGTSLADVSRDEYAIYNEAGKELEASESGGEWLAGCGTALSGLRGRFLAKRGAPTEIVIPDVYYITYLALIGAGSCIERRAAASKTIEALKGFDEVRIRSTQAGAEQEARTVPARYSVVVPPELSGVIRALHPAEGADALQLYGAGMHRFYLLDFAGAGREFRRLAAFPDPVAAALGSYLVARSSYWGVQFDGGGYSPDRFPPWEGLTGARAGDSPGSGRDEPLPPRCPQSGAEAKEECLAAVYERPVRPEYRGRAEEGVLAQARAVLARTPFVDPSLLDRYDGTADRHGERP